MHSALSQEILQRDYVRSLIIHHDMDRNGKAYAIAAKNNDLKKCYRLLKNGFLVYCMLNDALKILSKYSTGDKNLSLKLKRLRGKLVFMNHLRNKCS